MTTMTTLPTTLNDAPAPTPAPVRTYQAAPGYALAVQEMAARIQAVEQLYQHVMVDGVDYGVIPGTDKPTLLQPGAQLLLQLIGAVPTFELIERVEDWDRRFWHYVVRCRLISRATGEVVAEGLGSCNSREPRYRWRQAKRTCPQCGQASIIKGKAEYGGGWICHRRQDGCGARYEDEDARITAQPVGRIENEQIEEVVNTLLKQATKRSLVAAALNATGASRIFTQDTEDLSEHGEGATTTGRPPAGAPAGAKGTGGATQSSVGDKDRAEYARLVEEAKRLRGLLEQHSLLVNPNLRNFDFGDPQRMPAVGIIAKTKSLGGLVAEARKVLKKAGIDPDQPDQQPAPGDAEGAF